MHIYILYTYIKDIYIYNIQKKGEHHSATYIKINSYFLINKMCTMLPNQQLLFIFHIFKHKKHTRTCIYIYIFIYIYIYIYIYLRT